MSLISWARFDGRTFAPAPVAPLFYRLARRIFQIPFYICIKTEIVNADLPEHGGCILACTHFANLEPPCLSIMLRRRIDWMARTEFFQHPTTAWFLRAIDAIPIQRKGVPVKAIRTAIERARSGRTIGVFPEGGVTVGPASVCRGGPIKPGACHISMAAQVPIIPIVVLGADKLGQPNAWAPVRRGRLWVIFGRPLSPPAYTPGRAAATMRRAQRAQLCAQLQGRFVELYDELRSRYGIDDKSVP